jgi:glycosyltransferase involved in cell wall biosynthesis
MIEDNEQLIEVAYRDVLGRPADEGGKKTHLNAMKHCGIDDIKKLLRRSPEYRDVYKSILDGKIGKDVAYIDGNGNIVWTAAPTIPKLDSNSSTHSDQKPVMFVSTWGIKCGIATYTEHLLNSINKVRYVAGIFPINNRELPYTVDAGAGGVVHIQHEFGIMPAKFNSGSKVIVTFHTVPKNIKKTLEHFEGKFNIIGYIVHFEMGRSILSNNTKKEVWIIPHGSKIIPCASAANMKQCAREWLNFDKLGIKDGEDCAFMFGFQSGNKNFNQVIDACNSVGIKLIISGGTHQSGFTNIHGNYNNNVIFLNKYLNDIETDLFALSSDILLFDYLSQDHYSCSGAMHRVIGAGRPIICSRTDHFTDVVENEHCLKFKDRAELESKIREGLDRRDELGENALQYAISTSWDNVARQHLEIYKKHGAV